MTEMLVPIGLFILAIILISLGIMMSKRADATLPKNHRRGSGGDGGGGFWSDGGGSDGGGGDGGGGGGD